MKNRLRLAVIIILLVASLGLTACAVSPEVAYDNFITDLDVIYRFEEIAFDVEFGRYSSIFQSEINFLIVDLETFNIDSIRAKKINDKFISSAEDFLSASQSYLNRDDEAGDDYLKTAEAKYNSALSDFYDFIVE